MAITIEEREYRDGDGRDHALLVVSGRMTSTECQGELRNTVRALIEGGRKQVVLDLEAVPFIDSAGLGELVGSYASVVRLGGTLQLTNVNRRVADALASAGLDEALRHIERPHPPGARTVSTR